MTLLQNPMILLGLVAMVVLVGMPKLLENSGPPPTPFPPSSSPCHSHSNPSIVDPEIKKEFEERQKQGPMGGANPMAGFDMASWMAGSGSSTPAGKSSEPPTGGGGGGRTKRRG